MKRVKLNQNVGYWGKQGEVYDVSEEKARWLLRERIRQTRDGLELFALAELIEDLGLHFGQSHYNYKKWQKSKANFDRTRERMNVIRTLGLDKPKPKYLCKLCGCANNPEEYAMTMKGGRWYHDICLERKRRKLPPIRPSDS